MNPAHGLKASVFWGCEIKRRLLIFYHAKYLSRTPIFISFANHETIIDLKAKIVPAKQNKSGEVNTRSNVLLLLPFGPDRLSNSSLLLPQVF